MLRFLSSRGTIIKSLQNKTLKDTIREKITKQGPISFADYMETCLFDQQFGYYNKGKIFGKEGDFITSPEISQLFGETLAVWCASLYENWGKPDRWHVVEIGPGKGTLGADLIRSFKALKIQKGLSFHFIDLSKHLKEIQVQSVASAAGTLQYEKFKGIDRYFNKEISAYWYSTLPEMTQNYIQEYKGQNVIVIGHEVYDALPLHIFEFSSKTGWRERLVDLNSFDQFELVLSAESTKGVKDVLRPEVLFPPNKVHLLKDGDRIEVSSASHKLTNDICDLLKLGKNCALIIDYGEAHAFSDSIRGIKEHKKIPVEEWLQIPGEADLSGYVDFAAIQAIVNKFSELIGVGPMPQGFFLESMGISARVDVLSQKNPGKKERFLQDYERLASPEHMGEIYKVRYIGNKEVGQVYPFLESLFYEKNESVGNK